MELLNATEALWTNRYFRKRGFRPPSVRKLRGMTPEAVADELLVGLDDVLIASGRVPDPMNPPVAPVCELPSGLYPIHIRCAPKTAAEIRFLWELARDRRTHFVNFRGDDPEWPVLITCTSPETAQTVYQDLLAGVVLKEAVE